ncbi:MAG: hypothetical protein WD696_16075 [Bryobacteraceae bacterium]
MATLATFFRRFDLAAREEAGARTVVRYARRNRLRALPNEDVYFFSKRIDNSRLVREADPRARGECWSAIGVACVAAVLLVSTIAPNVAGILAGYQIQALKHERQQLLDERKRLEVAEASLLRPDRLEELARQQELVNPQPGQVIHLDGNDPALAMNLKTSSR